MSPNASAISGSTGRASDRVSEQNKRMRHQLPTHLRNTHALRWGTAPAAQQTLFSQ